MLPENVKWISIGGCGFFTNEKKLMFGGDKIGRAHV